MLREGARVDHLTAQVLCCEGLKLVSRDDEVREGVEGEGAVIVPEDRTGMERKGSKMPLTCDCLGKVRGDLSCLWEVDSIPAELGDNVLPEDDYLLRAVLHPGRVGQELCLRHVLNQVLGEMGWQRWAGENIRRAWVSWAGYKEEH